MSDKEYFLEVCLKYYMVYTSTKKLSIVYLQFKFNCIFMC